MPTPTDHPMTMLPRETTGAMQDKPFPVPGLVIYSVLSEYSRGIATGGVKVECFRPQPPDFFANLPSKSLAVAVHEYLVTQRKRLARMEQEVEVIRRSMVAAEALIEGIDVVA